MNAAETTETTDGVTGVFFRIFPPLAGALLGSIFTLVFLVVIKLGVGSSEGPMSLSRFLLFAVTFVAALSSNILATVFLALANRERFSGKFRQAMFHIFFMLIGLFLVCSPFFLFLSLETALLLSAFFLPFSSVGVLLLFQVFSQECSPLLASYSAIFGGLVLAGVFTMLSSILPIEMMLFFALPLSWLLLSTTSVVTQKIFHIFSDAQIEK